MLLILGIGAFKPNISTQVGALYSPGDHRRDRAYSIFYVGINVGAFLAPLVCGTLAVQFGWHYGFGAAGRRHAASASRSIFAARGHCRPRSDRPHAPVARARTRLDAGERRAVLALIAICAPVTLVLGRLRSAGQHAHALGRGFHRSSVDSAVWRGEIPSPWFLALNPLMIFLFTPVLVRIWAAQGARNRALPDPQDGFWLPLRRARQSGDGRAAWSAAGKASALWLVGYFVLATIGELHVAPVGLGADLQAAPRRPWRRS